MGGSLRGGFERAQRKRKNPGNAEEIALKRRHGGADIRVITTAEGMAALEPAWRALAATAGGAIEHYDWSDAYMRSGLEAGRPRILAAFHDGRLNAVLPFARKRVGATSRDVMLGVDLHHEPMDVLAEDDVSRTALAMYLAASRRPLIFSRLPSESPALPILRAALGSRWVVLVRSQPPYPFIPLDPSWDTPEDHLNSGRRSDLRRARRRAEQLGEVSFEVHAPLEAQLEPMLAEAFHVEARSWKGAAGTALLVDPRRASFIREYARAAARLGTLRICFLRIAGTAVAMQIAVQQNGGFWLIKIGYDESYTRCSPGVLLLRESIVYAVRQGMRSYELLGQVEPWIEAWTPHARGSMAVYAYPYNLRGAAALASDVAAKGVALTRQRLQRGTRGRRAPDSVDRSRAAEDEPAASGP